MAGRMRTVIESELFATQAAQLSINADALDALLTGVIWALSNRPDIFSEIDPVKHIWLVKGVSQVPYRIWYTFNNETVTLLAIERAD